MYNKNYIKYRLYIIAWFHSRYDNEPKFVYLSFEPCLQIKITGKYPC